MAELTDDIKFDLTIDEFNLDKEWLNQPKLYFEYASQLASAKEQLDQAKSKLELIKAEIDRAIRTDPAEYGLVKTTEVMVASTIVLQPEYAKATQAVIEEKYKVGILDAAVFALDNRRKALENAVLLWVKDYCSKPIAPEGTKEKMDEIEKKRARRFGRGRTKENK